MRYAYLIALPLALAVGGCGKSGAPEGQVIATVNGDEITRAQLNAVLAGRKLGDPKNAQAIRNAALDQLIVRQLLTQEARRQGLHKSQDYLLASRDADDRILAELLDRKVIQGVRTPDGKDLDRFIQENPSRFANRAILSVDQVRYPAGAFDPAKLADAHDMATVVGRLTAANVRYERDRVLIDSANVAPQLYARLMSLPAGDPFIVVQGGLTTVNTITGRQSMPVEGDEAEKLAVQVVRQDEARAALTNQLQSLRGSAEVKYQQGFAAPTRPPAKTAASPQKAAVAS